MLAAPTGAMALVIIDPVTPKPYSAAIVRDTPLGGTEATVIRVAEFLDAQVLQHNRDSDEGRYRRGAAPVAPTHLVVLREAAAALEAGERYPGVPVMLWLHDLAGTNTDRGRKLLSFAPRLAARGVTLVCVSDFHAADVRANLAVLPEAQRPAVIRIYNPVDVSGIEPGPAEVDPNKLVFFSSPHKGLDYTLYQFARLHARNPALRLTIANPGYLPSVRKQQSGVVNIGAVPHHVILSHVRSALCTFYPNYVYPETFGLALAESNVLGTPVLTHAIGAATEVLNGPDQIIAVPGARGLADSVFWRLPRLRPAGEWLLAAAGGAQGYEERIRRWQQGARPVVGGRPEFAMAAVGAAWRAACHQLSAGARAA